MTERQIKRRDKLAAQIRKQFSGRLGQKRLEGEGRKVGAKGGKEEGSVR